MIVLAILTTGACHRTMAPWPSDGDRREVAMYVRTHSLSGITTLPSVYQFFVYDKEKAIISQYNISPEKGENNLLHVKLFPGTYTGYCVTHAEDAEAWEFSENTPPEQIYLKSQKTKNGTEEAKDHLLGECDFVVNENENNSAIFDLNRKVGMLRVNIENIPVWLTDLKINLSEIPQKMNLKGEYEGTYTVSKSISLPDSKGTSETNLLVFPPRTKGILTLSSNAWVFITPEHPIESILPNHITEIKATFRTTSGSPEVDITTHLVEWEERIIEEPDWEIDTPEGPCTGSGNGINLVKNGSFEEGFTENTPNDWKLEASSKETIPGAISVSSPVREGREAVLLEAKTYMYQDVSIIGGRCYQLKMFVNAPGPKVKWRYWCTWMKGSTNLNSDMLHSPSYQYQTNGYINVFDGQIFRAPAEATKLRMEVRNYMNPGDDIGLYTDDISVEMVD